MQKGTARLAALRGNYRQVTWRLASRALLPVTVRSATLASDPDAPAPVWAEATLPGAEGRTIDLALPIATPLTALSIRLVGQDLLVPVRIPATTMLNSPGRCSVGGWRRARRVASHSLVVGSACFG